MGMQMDFKIESDNTELIKNATREAVIRALEAVGLQAEGYAKRLCPVDTGLLRNSITHSVGGVAFSHSYHAQYGSNRSKKTGKRISATSKNAGTVRRGSSSGTIGDTDEMTAYLSTNVEYASYVEYGTSHSGAQPFFKPAVQNHVSQYKKIFEEYLKDA